MNFPKRIFLVDDQLAVRKALARVLESANFEVMTYASGSEFLASGNAEEPGCLVLDLSMPEMGGLALQRKLVERLSVLPIIFLTGHGDISSGVEAMKHGAFDFLTKPIDAEKLIATVRAALDKNQQARKERNGRDEISQRLGSLTEREREVMYLVSNGKLNKQVADVLGIAEKTVKIHRAHVMEKMHAKSLADLVRMVDRASAQDTDRST